MFGCDNIRLVANDISSNASKVGGGLRAEHGAHIELADNVVDDNWANNEGGGLFFESCDYVELTANAITENSSYAGAGLSIWNSTSAKLSRNMIAGNRATWRGGDVGGGVHLVNSPEVGLTSEMVVSNTASTFGGGLYLDRSSVTVSNSVIADNQADLAGSGLYSVDSTSRLLHNTITRNRGSNGSGAYITGAHSAMSMTNTILAGHTVGLIVTVGNTARLEATLWGSDAWANEADWGGAGTISTGTVNIWGDPGFVNPDSGNYHIAASSAAVDAGVDASVTTDIDGDARPDGCSFDIGADELITGRPCARIYLPLVVRNYSHGDRPAVPVLDLIENEDGDGDYAVNWSASAGATSYTLEEDDNEFFTSPTPVYSGPLTSRTFSDMEPGTYCYRVNASNATGASDWSDAQCVTVNPAPDAPTLGEIENEDGDGDYTVNWSASAGATSYTLEEDDNEFFTSPTIAYSGPLTSTTFSDMEPGTYCYRVNASNATGTSDWSNVQCTVVEPPGGWTTIKREDFEAEGEEEFPHDWIVRDDDTIFGETYWAKRDCNPYNGSYSGWSVGGGDGEAFECNRNGNMYVDSWMIYGPFSLADASAADLSFRVWMHLLPFPGDPISGDGIHACASTDGPFEPGDNEGCRSEGVGSAPYLYLNWDLMELDLTNVPELGDLTGEPEVWIGLKFTADHQLDQVNMGAYVDDIVLRKYVGSMPASSEEGIGGMRMGSVR